MTDIRVRFGNALRACRTRQRLTQEELAERAGLSHKFISEIERGLGNPTIETVSRIAAALTIGIGDLFDAANQAASEDHYRISKRDLQAVREAADSLDSVMQRFPSNPAVRYRPRTRTRKRE